MKRNLELPSIFLSIFPSIVLSLILTMNFAEPVVGQPAGELAASPTRGITAGPFPAETRRSFDRRAGLPDDQVRGIAVAADGTVYAGTVAGLARFDGQAWLPTGGFAECVSLVAAHGDAVIVTTASGLYAVRDGDSTRLANLPEDIRSCDGHHSLVAGDRVLFGTSGGLYLLEGTELRLDEGLDSLLGKSKEVRQVAVAADGRRAVAAAAGLFVHTAERGWHRVEPRDERQGWSLQDVRGVTFDDRQRLWFASPQGVGVLGAEATSLYTGEDGLPYNDFTTVASGADGIVWLGTRRGAIRYDGRHWRYRSAPRWLPHNEVRGIAVAPGGNTWLATAGGVGLLETRAMTLAQKAQFFEEEIDKYHRRTPYGYVDSVRLHEVGDKSAWTQHDSDNDGLWTAMYGAGECFAYAATRDMQAKQRATRAFEALRFLSQVTQGGTHPAPPGFPARSILPTSGPDPNVQDSPERDRQQQQREPLWKVIQPRWPKSADGQWYWKCDTSSDELDGHYFLYACYYDLVAETDAEKQRVRDVVVAITDHLIDHNYELIDHDGRPTRWARFSPEVLNGGILVGERGLNSLSVLSYLKVAEHMTGNAKYRQAYQSLIDQHFYATNVLEPKVRNGLGTGNQSDDEMAFMCYYNLLNYERTPALRQQYLWSLRWYWCLEEPERCPLFNFIYAALDDVSTAESLPLPVAEAYLADGVDTLQRIPLDRVLWSYQNSHRLDIVPFPPFAYRDHPGGHLRNGRVVPVDERGLEHWNQDPWQLDAAHDGRTLTDGAAFLLPYYLGRYHGFIRE